MGMKQLEDLKDLLCEELDEISKKGELSAGSLETIEKLTSSIKNIDKIIMYYEYEYSNAGYSMYDGYSMDDGYSDADYSQRRYSRANRYSQAENSYGMTSGNSYRGRGRYSRGYSRDDGKEYIVGELKNMMGMASNEKEREAIRNCIHAMEKS